MSHRTATILKIGYRRNRVTGATRPKV